VADDDARDTLADTSSILNSRLLRVALLPEESSTSRRSSCLEATRLAPGVSMSWERRSFEARCLILSVLGSFSSVCNLPTRDALSARGFGLAFSVSSAEIPPCLVGASSCSSSWSDSSLRLKSNGLRFVRGGGWKAVGPSSSSDGSQLILETSRDAGSTSSRLLAFSVDGERVAIRKVFDMKPKCSSSATSASLTSDAWS
jgi:hypothetical protein